ncbi:MAG: 3-phosphoserine/phosphohydroxythreonine transaminase [Anaerovoracaceae bacterium]|jgi:phosphoserine aminotransferase
MNKKERVFNFSAGPSTLPLQVLEQAAGEMTNYQNCGMSAMELSHRSKEFVSIIETAEQDLRDLMNIPDSYKVLFLHGGGSLQFAMVPLNLLRKSKIADYIVTDYWANKAVAEAKKFGTINIVASSEDKKFSYIPDVDKIAFTKDADYVHFTHNNTIAGTRFTQIPDTGKVPLVCDMSSMILSEEVDVTDYDLIYAGAQKNIGPSGVTIVIIKEDLLGFADESVPSMLNYKAHADANSIYNTPPCYPIYVSGLTFKWIKERGGVAAMQEYNEKKASLLYDAIDNSNLFKCPVNKKDRSLMNVVFVTGDPNLDKKFVSEAGKAGFVSLEGHRSVGGMRVSIYNAMSQEGVTKLIQFMQEFEKNNK